MSRSSTEKDLVIPMLYVRWKVAKSSSVSRTIQFQGIEWFLAYRCEGASGKFLFLFKKYETFGPFSVAVHLESRTGRIFPELSNIRSFDSCPLESSIIWKKMHDDIEQVDLDYRNKPELRFLIVLKADDFLTECNFSDGGSRHCCTLTPDPYISGSACLKNLSDDFSKLLQEQDSITDVEFLCADHSIKAHKVIVSARSAVFASMLRSDMIEGRTGVIKVPDMTQDIFKHFLKYLYTGDLKQLTFEVAMKLYEAGDKYAVLGLAKRCSKFLIEHLSVENACEALVLAEAHSDVYFKNMVIGYILEQKIPLSGDCWRDFCDSHSILAIELLNLFCVKLSKMLSVSKEK